MKKLTIEDVKNDTSWEIPGESFYTIGEVAEILEVTKPTIKNYIKKGKIKGEKILGKWCVPEDNLRKYLGLWYKKE